MSDYTPLPTNLADDLLAPSQNGKRTFNIVDSEGNIIASNVHLEDVSSYTSIGDNYGASNINSQNAEINSLHNAVSGLHDVGSFSTDERIIGYYGNEPIYRKGVILTDVAITEPAHGSVTPILWVGSQLVTVDNLKCVLGVRGNIDITAYTSEGELSRRFRLPAGSTYTNAADATALYGSYTYYTDNKMGISIYAHRGYLSASGTNCANGIVEFDYMKNSQS